MLRMELETSEEVHGCSDGWRDRAAWRDRVRWRQIICCGKMGAAIEKEEDHLHRCDDVCP